MNQLHVESLKGINEGFVLSESELRRIVQTVSEELKKALPTVEPHFTFLLKFANGVVAETLNLEDVFNQENIGSARILKVRFEAMSGEGDNEHRIIVLFRNTDLDNDFDSIPIKYSIVGKSRDWVFIASSTIEERLNKVKRKIFDPSMSRKTRMMVLLLMLPLMLILSSMPIFLTDTHTNNTANELEIKWKKGEIKDPVEAMIFIEKSKLPTGQLAEEYKPILIIGCFIFIILLGFFFIRKYYPIFNFCWGDYLGVYEKIESQRKTLIWVIIIGLIVSVAGSIIANAIGGIKIF